MKAEAEWNKLIDPIVHQCALELSYRAGADCRKIMLDSGMTESEVDDVVRKAFEWRHGPSQQVLS